MANDVSGAVRRRCAGVDRTEIRVVGQVRSRRGASGGRLLRMMKVVSVEELAVGGGVALAATEYDKPEHANGDLEHARQIVIVVDGQQLAVLVRVEDVEGNVDEAVQPLKQCVELVELADCVAIETEATKLGVVLALALEHAVLRVVDVGERVSWR